MVRPKVGYLGPNDQFASGRLRFYLPFKHLYRNKQVDIADGEYLVTAKQGFSWHELPPHKKLIYDVCDNHFHSEHEKHYREGCALADVIVCNSIAMQDIIKKETGRSSTVIPEPYEGDECEPKIGKSLLWFGHRGNLKDLLRLEIKMPVKVLSNHPDYERWTPKSFDREIGKPCIVIIPTGASQAKSENRIVESIRRGRYVCAEHLLSYEAFSDFMHIGDIRNGIDYALSNEDMSVQAIKDAQSYIRNRYSVPRIASMWMNVL